MSLPTLVSDVRGHIFKNFDVYNVLSCMCVSKKWNVFLKEDAIWNYFTQHYQIHAEVDKFKAIHERIFSTEKALRKRCSKEFLLACSILFGSNTFLQRFPVIEIEEQEMTVKQNFYRSKGVYSIIETRDVCFPDKCFSFPVAILLAKDYPNLGNTSSFLVCSVYNSKESIGVQIVFNFGLNTKKQLYIDLFHNSSKMKLQFEQFSGFKLLSSKHKFECLRKIIEGTFL